MDETWEVSSIYANDASCRFFLKQITRCDNENKLLSDMRGLPYAPHQVLGGSLSLVQAL